MAKTVTQAGRPDAPAGTVVRHLLAAGADPQPVDRWGGTPRSDAEANGHGEIAALLGHHTEHKAPVHPLSDTREEAAV